MLRSCSSSATASVSEIIQTMNDLFEGDFSDGDLLSFYNTVESKVKESPVLAEQAQNNGPAQFEASPELEREMSNAFIEVFEANQRLGRQALNSPQIRERIKFMMLAAGLYEGLRGRLDSGW